MVSFVEGRSMVGELFGRRLSSCSPPLCGLLNEFLFVYETSFLPFLGFLPSFF
jgi:hypothetical protein